VPYDHVKAELPLVMRTAPTTHWVPFLESVNVDPDFVAPVEFNPTLPAEICLRKNVATR
jgi:hypothetical protein